MAVITHGINNLIENGVSRIQIWRLQYLYSLLVSGTLTLDTQLVDACNFQSACLTFSRLYSRSWKVIRISVDTHTLFYCRWRTSWKFLSLPIFGSSCTYPKKRRWIFLQAIIAEWPLWVWNGYIHDVCRPCLPKVELKFSWNLFYHFRDTDSLNDDIAFPPQLKKKELIQFHFRFGNVTWCLKRV